MDSVLSSGKVAEGQIQCAEEVVDEAMGEDVDDDDDEEEEEDDDDENNMDTSVVVESAPQVWSSQCHCEVDFHYNKHNLCVNTNYWIN